MDAKEKEMIQKLVKDNSCRVKLADSLVCPSVFKVKLGSSLTDFC